MGTDALSDLLRTVRLSGAAFFDVGGTAPWVVESPPPGEIAARLMPGADHLISYHVVTAGSCYGGLVGEPPRALGAGEVIVFTRGDRHVMASAPGLRAPPVPEDYADSTVEQRPFHVHQGGDGPVTTRLVCGFLGCDARPFNPLIETLPPVLVATDRDGDRGWLARFIGVAIAESSDKRAGGESVLAKLSELMFIEVVRRYIESLPADRAGWLAGLRDPFVGRALSLLHARPAHAWTIEELARAAGVSRSVLAERFSGLLGVPPMHYLAAWRMQIAAGLLAGSSAGIAQIAAEIGYESEAAFSRAFRKATGMPPAMWRKGKRNGE